MDDDLQSNISVSFSFWNGELLPYHYIKVLWTIMGATPVDSSFELFARNNAIHKMFQSVGFFRCG